MMNMRYLKLFGSILLTVVMSAAGYSQSSHNMTELGFLAWPETVSEVRGAALNGQEYALLGSNSGFSIVDVTDPTNMAEVAWFGGASSIWRDPFYFNEHAYCVTEGGGGLLIVDMSPLPGSTTLNSTYFTGDDIVWSSAHNMFIDENGICYIFGSDQANGGAIMYDLNTDPMAPEQVGVWDEYYIHDGFVRGDTMWLGCINDGFAAVVDVTDKANPVTLTTWNTPSNFTHNIWPSDNNSHAFTTDEVSSGYIGAYDVTDLDNVFETDRYNHPLSENVIPHNVHYFNGWLVTAHYRDGVTVHDAHDPDNLVLTGWFDPASIEGNGFNSAWGAWPYLPSGNVLMSDVETGLYVIGPTYVEAAALSGTVTEFGTGTPLSGVNVEIVTPVPNTQTDIFGDYASGTADAGSYTVEFTRAGYLPVTETNVMLVNGQTTVLDVEMVPDIPFNLVGLLVDGETGNPITGGEINLTNEFYDINKVSGSIGEFGDTAFFAGTYSVTAGIWGNLIFCEDLMIQDNGDTLIIELDPGYQDNFDLDLGWQVTGTANVGEWERGIPEGTDYQGVLSNPEIDSDDCGALAYVSGLASGSNVGSNDLDDGTTVLTCPPMDLSNMAHPHVSFSYWFFNSGGNSVPNDSLWMVVDNGITTATISIFTDGGIWQPVDLQLDLFIETTSNMTISYHAVDDDPGHLVEVGLDDFLISDSLGVSVQDLEANNAALELYPNPTTDGSFTLTASFKADQGLIRIVDVSGRVLQEEMIGPGVRQVQGPNIPGVYMVELLASGSRTVKRLVVQE